MDTLKSAALIFGVVLITVFIVPWVPTSAKASTAPATPVALRASSGQAVQFASARVLRADWGRGDRDFHRWGGDRDDWGDRDDGGFYYGGGPYYGYQPYYYNPYYYNRQPYGFWFNF